MTSEPSVARASLLVAMIVSGCAAPMARMDPIGAEGKDVRYRNGTPIVISRGARFDVLVAPEGGPTGRYKIENVLRFSVGVRNHCNQRVLVSESSISARGGGGPARVVSAVEIEDSILSDAALAQGLNAVAGAMRAMGAGMARDRLEQKQAIQETAANAEVIRAREAGSLGRVATLFQRNTIEPGDSYVGAVVVERNDGDVTDGSSRIRLTVNVDREVHAFDFNEQAPRRARVSLPRGEVHTVACQSSADCDGSGGICYEGTCRH